MLKIQKNHFQNQIPVDPPEIDPLGGPKNCGEESASHHIAISDDFWESIKNVILAGADFFIRVLLRAQIGSSDNPLMIRQDFLSSFRANYAERNRDQQFRRYTTSAYPGPRIPWPPYQAAYSPVPYYSRAYRSTSHMVRSAPG